MIPLTDLWPILIAWAVSVASPGPAVVAIIGTAMAGGPRIGAAMTAGVLIGSAFWATVAGLGFGAAMLTHPWLAETLRYAGAAYILFLSAKSLRAAFTTHTQTFRSRADTPAKAWRRGAMIHLTNPKAALFWGGLFALAVPAEAPTAAVLQVGLSCFAVSVTVLLTIALVFSTPTLSRAYLTARRWFDGTFGLLFGYAALKLLTARFV